MQVIQLGNGDGLHPEVTSSSFLIKLTPREKNYSPYLLFDCGHGVIKKLQELQIPLTEIDNVFISHIHEDHVANLLSLIYIRYFNHLLTTNIYCSSSVLEDLNTYLSTVASKIYISGKVIWREMYHITFKLLHTPFKELITSVPGNHQVVPSSGILILPEDSEKEHALYISGDTKADQEIEELVNRHVTDSALLFHDYSYFNKPSRNVHACDSDISAEYSQKFAKSLNYYHNMDQDFYSEWIDLRVDKFPENDLKLYRRNL